MNKYPISPTAAAKAKGCSRMTVYNYAHLFDWTGESAGKGMIIPNQRFANWQPKTRKRVKK